MTTVLFPLAVDFVVRTTLLAAAIAVTLALFRIHASGLRHAAWRAALVVMLLMPILLQFVPAIDMPRPRFVTPHPAAEYIDPPVVPATPSADIATSPAATNSRAAGDDMPVALPRDAHPGPDATWFQWPTVVVSLYAGTSAYLLFRIVLGLIRLSRIRRGSRRIGTLAGEVFESSAVVSPVTIGVLRPRVLLPVAWREWPADMLTAVLAHEGAHASRRDPLIAVLARLNCALYWFHPLAWWLERELAVTAEHACDDAAVGTITRSRYTETLLEMATAVRRNQGRLVWQGVGVHGNGQLGHRIDRLLAATAMPAISRTRRASAFASCVVMVVGALACRQSPAPLRADPNFAAELAREEARRGMWSAARLMTPADAATLELDLERTPEDMLTREKLLVFYRLTSGRGQPDPGNAIAARRRHELWLIQHHPDSQLMASAHVPKLDDPEGYERARQLWMATLARPDANALTLSNAASFFQSTEVRLAEQILLRGQTQPGAPAPAGADGYYRDWSVRLGHLYGVALAQSKETADAKWAGEKLEQSADAVVLYEAGKYLAQTASVPTSKSYGWHLIELAGQFDPTVARGTRAPFDARMAFRMRYGAVPRTQWAELLAKSSGLDRLRRLAVFAEREYSDGEYYDWIGRQPESVRRSAGRGRSVTPQQNRQSATGMFARSKAYAGEAITLAESLDPDSPPVADALFRAHVAYGLNALREGDRGKAIRHLREASHLPVSEPQFLSNVPSTLEMRLLNYLLKNGERHTIIDYLERSATHRENGRDDMIKAATAIREGRMPEHYQRALALGHL